MEISKPQIARLVLGYLKSEKCKSAFNEFLLKSPYLKSYAVFVKNGKYFATRVGGLTLEDIIAEYSDIALIVQGRLEQTDYYEKGHKMKLSEQLTYILDNDSRSSSPALSKNLEATPIESLPGNSSNNSHKSFTSSPAKSTVEADKCTSTEDENTPNTQQETSEKDERSLAELDNQIRSIRQKSEKDPVFDKLLEEIIGHKNEAPTISFTTKNTENNRCNPNTETGQNCATVLNLEITDDFSNKRAPQSDHTTKKTTLDPYTIKPTQQNQFFLTNTGGLLMVPSIGGGSNSSYILLNSGQPTAPNNALTESDIMKMPTLIFEDAPSAQQQIVTAPKQSAVKHSPKHKAQPAVVVTQSQIIVTSRPPAQNATFSTVTTQKPKTLKTIAPKTDKITIATCDGDFYKEIDKDAPPEESPEKPKGRGGLRKRSTRLSKAHKEALSSPNQTSAPTKGPEVEKRRKSSAKNLFKENNTKGPLADTWDAELRELLIPKKKNNEESEANESRLNVSCDDEELKREAMLIEAAFKTPLKEPPTPKPKEKDPEDIKEIEKVSEENPVTEKTGSQPDKAEEIVIVTEETELQLRNCNGPPRIKKKCNQTETTEVFEILEVVEETVATVKGEEVKERRFLSLETPIKEGVPKTPGKCEMTPFSRAIEEQLQGMDLLSIPTPSVAIPTPNFPITPNIDLCTPEHHSNRPTDYSTSSSYYQPSDTEQNKSLELMMEQYRKEEKKKEEAAKAEEKKVESGVGMGVSDMKRLFNKNVIGKKNLNLMKKSPTASSSSSSSSSDSSDSDFEDGSVKNDPGTPRESYSFRKRNVPTPTIDPGENKTSPGSTKKVTVRERVKSVRKVTVKTSSPATRKNPLRVKTGKVSKNETKTSPKANDQLDNNENEVTDDDFALHLSTDEDSVNKEGVNKNKEETVSASPRKEEPPTEVAKQLIQDLYERGIHLLPKVSLKKLSESSSSEATGKDLEPEKDPNALENLEVSSEDDSIVEAKQANKSDLNGSVNPENVIFDCKTFEEKDHIKLVYDSSKRRKKKVYDLTLLEKKIEADVYVDSLDIDMKRIITFTPTVAILDYSPKKAPVKRRKSVKPESKPQTKVKKQEDVIPKLEKEKVDGTVEKDKQEEGEPKVYSKKLRSRGASDKGIQSAANEKKKVTETSPSKSDRSGSTVKEVEKEDMPTLSSADDDLMNFAVLGSPIEKEKETSGKSREKRKLSSGGESSQPEKKTKTETEKQALLKNVNVDLFLNELHGGSKLSK